MTADPALQRLPDLLSCFVGQRSEKFCQRPYRTVFGVRGARRRSKPVSNSLVIVDERHSVVGSDRNQGIIKDNS